MFLLPGFKVSLSPDSSFNITSIDHDNLQLVWTVEKLQLPLDVVDLRYEMSRKSVVASLKEGNKRLALRYARALKLTSESREKLALLMSRVDEVLHHIADAESTTKLSEAIQIAGQVMKDIRLDMDQLEQSLQDLDEAAYIQEHIHNALRAKQYSPSLLFGKLGSLIKLKLFHYTCYFISTKEATKLQKFRLDQIFSDSFVFCLIAGLGS